MYGFTHSKAVRGQNVRTVGENDFPYVAFITVTADRYFNPLNPFVCTGSLISQQYILCSEHCLKDKSIDDIVIHVGSHDRQYSNIYNPEWWVSYELWTMHKSRRISNPGEYLLSIIRVNSIENI
jgi:hypothetical protein